jgi:hypothetical protein
VKRDAHLKSFVKGVDFFFYFFSCDIDAPMETVYPDNEGIIAIDLKEDERLELLLKRFTLSVP